MKDTEKSKDTFSDAKDETIKMLRYENKAQRTIFIIAICALAACFIATICSVCFTPYML